MSRNPLLLSLLCLVAWRRREIPRRRAELYKECLGVLLESRVEHRAREERGEATFQRRWGAVSAMAALDPLAWAMQVGGDGVEPTVFDEAAALGLIGPAMQNVRELAAVPPAEFLHAISDGGCGVLLSPEAGRHRFFHLTFQEFLATQNAAARGAAGELVSRLGDPGWREMILLSMAEKALFRPFFEGVLARPDAAAHRDLLRLCLDEAAVVDVSPFVEVLERAAAQPPNPPPASAASDWQRLWRLVGLWTPPPPLPPPPDPRPAAGTVAIVLGLFATRPHPAIRRAAEGRVGHQNAEVAAGAREIVDPTAAPSRTGEPEVGDRWTLELDGLAVPFVWVPPGEFWMGAAREKGQPGFDPMALEGESPVRRVRISRGFWLGQHPVTNALYRRYLEGQASHGQKPEEPGWSRDAHFNQPNQPVVAVSWRAAQDFCGWLSDRITGGRGPVGLPTEAEWEWAARGPEGRRYPWGKREPTTERAVFAQDQPAQVGGRPLGAGPFGAHDQAGNIWEWCQDIFVPYDRTGDTVIDPCADNDNSGEAPRVIRGGSWAVDAGLLRCAGRLRDFPGRRGRGRGFRVVCRSTPHI